MLRHWLQFFPNMSTDIRGHEALHHHHGQQDSNLTSDTSRERTSCTEGAAGFIWLDSIRNGFHVLTCVDAYMGIAMSGLG